MLYLYITVTQLSLQNTYSFLLGIDAHGRSIALGRMKELAQQWRLMNKSDQQVINLDQVVIKFCYI